MQRKRLRNKDERQRSKDKIIQLYIKGQKRSGKRQKTTGKGQKSSGKGQREWKEFMSFNRDSFLKK